MGPFNATITIKRALIEIN